MKHKKKNCILCLVLVNIDQQKNVMQFLSENIIVSISKRIHRLFCGVSANFIFSYLSLTEFFYINFLSNLDHFHSGLGGATRTSVFSTIKKNYVCLPLGTDSSSALLALPTWDRIFKQT